MTPDHWRREWQDLAEWMLAVATIESVDTTQALFRRLRALVDGDPLVRQQVLAAIETLALLVKEGRR